MTLLTAHLIRVARLVLSRWRIVRNFASEVARLRRELRRRYPGSVD